MNHFTWTYLADNGKRHQVGLFHGHKTGHLFISINSNIMTIDFEVLKSKTYSFFIDEEVCEIKLKRKGDTFYYDFKINNKIDTPLNRVKKKMEKQNLMFSLLFFGVLVGLSMLATFFIR